MTTYPLAHLQQQTLPGRWVRSVIPAFMSLREDCELKANLGYKVGPCLKTPKITDKNSKKCVESIDKDIHTENKPLYYFLAKMTEICRN
jgi:hypothetical protein